MNLLAGRRHAADITALASAFAGQTVLYCCPDEEAATSTRERLQALCARHGLSFPETLRVEAIGGEFAGHHASLFEIDGCRTYPGWWRS